MFERHRDDFESLARMAQEDFSLHYFHRDFLMLDGNKVWRPGTPEGFSSARYELYMSHFRRFPKWTINSFDKNGKVLQFSPGSVVTWETENSFERIVFSKSIAYSEVPISPLVESLDGVKFETFTTLYKSIGGNWYLYRSGGISKPE